MQWFIVQRISDAPSGGTNTEYLGPFYGNPSAALPLLGYGYHVLVYVNGAWAAL